MEAAGKTRDELKAELVDLEQQRTELNEEWTGKKFDDEAHSRFNLLCDGINDLETTLAELDKRDAIISRGLQNGQVEKPNFPAPGSVRGEDIYDLGSISRNWNDPEADKSELRSRALRAVEMAKFPHPVADRRSEDMQGHLERLLDGGECLSGEAVARHFLLTGSPGYKRAFTKYLSGEPRTQAEEGMLSRAMSLTTTSGGFAVPFVLDPSVVPTSDGAINPYRQIGDVISISVDEWRGVSSAGITAAFQAEAAAVTDQSPTLAQPTVSTEMGRVFIPYSIEIGMDWGSFASEMGQLISDSKDVLEATKMAVGSGTNEPFGVVTGATTVFTASNTNSIVIADVYSVHNALGPRFRNRAVWTFNNAVLDKIRQIDTAGGSQMLQPNIQLRSAAEASTMTDGRAGVDLFGHPVYEASGQSGAITTGQLIGVVGDYSRYFKIVDRIGLTVENIPHIFGASQGNLPTGQRGLFAYWRVGSKVLHANAFRTLKLA